MGAIGDLIGWIATPLFYAISGILVLWHKLFTTLGLSESNGWAWVLAIIGLTVTIRAMLIPLFVKQINASRNMQLIQPKVKELQKKYGHDRQRLSEETMKLYKESGTNPFASCLPLLIQMPIFFVLFRILNHAAHGTKSAFVTTDLAHKFQASHWLGSQLGDSFTKTDDTSTKVLAILLVVAMIVTQFITQRQLMAKNMPPAAMSGQYATQQKMMLYVLPLVFAVGGIAFPIGQMIYWTVSNLWTMGQQFYVIRNNPAPGTPAFDAKVKRDRAKAAKHGESLPTETAQGIEVEQERRQAARQQPKRQSRSQRTGQAKKPASSSAPVKKKGGKK